jgi:hypothetical protein
VPDDCKFRSGEVVSASSDSRLLSSEEDCEFEEGVTILLTGDEPASPPPPSDLPPPATKAQEASRKMPGPSKGEDAQKVQPQDEVVAVEEAPQEELQATTEAPDAAPTADDIAKAASAAGDNPMLAIGLAALVVLGGGGAMWKFIQQKGKASAELDQKRAEQDHELKLKELEIRASQSSGPDYSATQPPPCQASSLKQEQSIASMGGQVSSLREELEQLKARLVKLEKKSASFSADFDADEMRELVEKHERDIKALKAPKRTR